MVLALGKVTIHRREPRGNTQVQCGTQERRQTTGVQRPAGVGVAFGTGGQSNGQGPGQGQGVAVSGVEAQRGGTLRVAEAVARGHGKKRPPVSGLRQPKGEGMGGETEKEGAADTAWWGQGRVAGLGAPSGGRWIRLHRAVCEVVDGLEAGVGQGTHHHHIRVHQGGCERAAGSREEAERHLGERSEGPMREKGVRLARRQPGSGLRPAHVLSWGPDGSRGVPRRGVHLRAGRRDSLSGERGRRVWGFLGLPEGSGNMAKTAVGKSQLWVLEHSVGPRPLLSGIEIWGVAGLATLSVPKLPVLVSVLPSPARPREKHLCPAQDSAGATAHLRRAWADERGGRGQSPLFPLGWCGISFSVKAPCSRHPSRQPLTLAAGFFFVQLRSRMGRLPWKCSP